MDADDQEEELLTIADADEHRWHSRLIIGKDTVKFMLDYGATVNLLPVDICRQLGRMNDVRPATTTLPMFDRTKMATRGVITLTVQHPKTKREYD